jgi:hypothetical protein
MYTFIQLSSPSSSSFFRLVPSSLYSLILFGEEKRSYVHTRIRGDRASLNVKRIKPRCFFFSLSSSTASSHIIWMVHGVLFSTAIGYWKACIQIHGQSRRRPNSP